MFRWLHANVVYRAATLSRGEGSVFRYLDEMRRAQRLPAEELLRRQDRHLARLLTAAGRSSPFYRERWGGPLEVTPESARERLRELPFLAKSDLQQHRDEMLCVPHPGRTTDKTTGGSTAQPVRITKTSDGLAREMAASWMALEWSGIRMGDRAVRFWGTPLTRTRRVRFALADMAMNRIRLSAFDLDEEDLARYWERCVRFQPRWFYGYASLIHLFAEYVEGRGLDGTRLGLRAIVPTSEPLTERQRERIGRVFGAPIQNEYGCGEVGAIAYECGHGSLHVMSENVLVEVLTPEGRPAETGETGEVIVTDLTNYAMPLVRYRVGDFAVQGGPCGCGRPFPNLREVWGRIHDVVYTPTGRRWHGEKLDYLMVQLHSETGAFRQYQVVQDGPDTLEVRLVTDGDLSPEFEARIQSYVRERLDGMRARIRRVEQIERAPSGKLRVVRNDWLAGAAARNP